MRRLRLGSSAPIVFVVVLLIAFAMIMRKPHFPGSRLSTLGVPTPEELRRPRVTDRARRNEYFGQLETGPPPNSSCESIGVSCESEYFEKWQKPGVDTCTPVVKSAYPLPDSRCTP